MESSITLEKFREITADMMDELPEIFFNELNNGVIVQDYAKPHPQRLADDLYILGEYHRSSSSGRGIVLYYGSFARMFPYYDEEQMTVKVREVLRHEFRHHLEGLSGLRDLEVEDDIFLRNYLDTHGK
ncbi:metallopeptidase family protein [Aminicella lysinilytica]|uniref:Putative Zn-dependent protease with MMP-like domain n=1 Tax=Aminicella lysinilytica TaxID=433323 RepID=A0A4R6Q9U5_9FIRM|nr:metallopeptidase family protein [Aminicella lysinilytica]NLD11027.1 metallopeptidase family protein [Clostridiales bacterium]TDP59101.1 putative Zn-dependent protease with MMP-like domain [Aminicella lysinilytica]